MNYESKTDTLLSFLTSASLSVTDYRSKVVENVKFPARLFVDLRETMRVMVVLSLDP